MYQRYSRNKVSLEEATRGLRNRILLVYHCRENTSLCRENTSLLDEGLSHNLDEDEDDDEEAIQLDALVPFSQR